MNSRTRSICVSSAAVLHGLAPPLQLSIQVQSNLPVTSVPAPMSVLLTSQNTASDGVNAPVLHAG